MKVIVLIVIVMTMYGCGFKPSVSCNVNDINTVKVLLDRDGFAVNFRREPVETEAGG